MLCCLSYLIPGKIGVVVRRVCTLLGGIALLYLGAYVWVVKSLDTTDVKIKFIENTVMVEFRLHNKSFANVTINEFNFLNEAGDRVPRVLKAPVTPIPPYSSRIIKNGYKLDQYAMQELTLTTLMFKHSYKNDLKN